MAESIDLTGLEEGIIPPTETGTQCDVTKIETMRTEKGHPFQPNRTSRSPPDIEIIDLESETDEQIVPTLDHSEIQVLPGNLKNGSQYKLPRGKEIKRCILPNGDRVGSSNTVELQSRPIRPQEFLLVHHVIMETTEKDPIFWLIGLKLRRNEDSDGFLPHGSSGATEVSIMLRSCQTDRRPTVEQSLERINARRALRKRSCLLTNQLYPSRRSTSPDMLCQMPLSQDVLVCRWIQTLLYKEMEANIHDKNLECSLQRLSENGCSLGYSFSDAEIWKNSNRGSLVQDRSAPTADLVSEASQLSLSGKGSVPIPERYTFGEGFCGAGGTSWALQEASFKARWAFDRWDVACRSHDLHINDITCHQMGWATFIRTIGSTGRVDVLHLSPPSQWCNKTNLQDNYINDMYRRCFLATGSLVDTAKCRILILDVADSVLGPEHVPHFRTVIHDLTSRNYSVRWRIAHMDEYGNVYKRKCLMLFAAAPGENLPAFPRPTHGSSTSLAKPTTIESAIKNVNFLDDLHNVADVIYQKRQPRYRADRPLSKCVFGNGTNLAPPGGIREFTFAELREFQGFQGNHRFAGTKTEIREQIVDALPGKPFVNFTKMCMEAMKETDRKYRDTFAIKVGNGPNAFVGQQLPMRPRQNATSSNVSSASSRKRGADSMSPDTPSPLEKKSRIESYPVYITAPTQSIHNNDIEALGIPHASIRYKVAQIVAELPHIPAAVCHRVLLGAEGNVLAAVVRLVRLEAKGKLAEHEGVSE
ncbi:S-adenosyl-L-methionine-dependent methyltransferase [Viridothelium virens]|uniref:DNA (cytosine-5-)-methyltransferase n=1 Tax=Viridothelium virens TaxID=1048519 RepID=A0A6A6GWA9_VIRVR|nr:S-adenosyl-L-methionine-dependent methyltransferase [Viridothelium virens]